MKNPFPSTALLIPSIALMTFMFPACGDAKPDDEPEVEVTVTETTTEDSAVQAEDENRSVDSLVDDDSGTGLTSDESVERASGSDRSTVRKSSNTGSTASTGKDRSTNDGRTAAAYSPASFDALLKKYVSNGRVNYAGFGGDSDFTAFVDVLRTADPASMSTDEALAFWINAYNALVIRNVLDHPGTKNPLDVKGFFDGIRFDVAGRSLTLNDIENKVIRPTYNEPLIHFGLVCAAVSCPPLITTAYTGANVRSTLRKNATNYLSDPAQNRFDASTGTLHLSKIFEWYISDFGNSEDGVISFVEKYGPSSMIAGLKGAGDVSVEYNEYNWSLNGK